MRASTRAIAAALFAVATGPMLARAQASGGVSPAESRLRPTDMDVALLACAAARVGAESDESGDPPTP